MAAFPANKHGVVQKPRLLDEVRARIRAKHYSRRTEESYTHQTTPPCNTVLTPPGFEVAAVPVAA